jgi:uncharacterized protein YebE (UPF0316 family)
MSKEIILVLAAIVFLIIAIYTIREISKLNISRSHKTVLYYITVIVPVLGLFLVMRARQKA